MSALIVYDISVHGPDKPVVVTAEIYPCLGVTLHTKIDTRDICAVTIYRGDYQALADSLRAAADAVERFAKDEATT